MINAAASRTPELEDDYPSAHLRVASHSWMPSRITPTRHESLSITRRYIA